MDDLEKSSDANSGHRPFHIRLPGFLINDEVGLGDAIKRVTFKMGIQPCSGCERRAETLNLWAVFSPNGPYRP